MNEQEYILRKCNKNIGELVYEKTEFFKARNYYLGFRDPAQFKYLELNYGLGNPDKVRFHEFTSNHINELVGRFLSSNREKSITCNDNQTMHNILVDKLVGLNNVAVKSIRESINSFLNDKNSRIDDSTKNYVHDNMKKYSDSFISDYEIASQNILTWASQDQRIDYQAKTTQILTNGFVYGYMPYRMLPSANKKYINFTAPDPCWTYIEANPNSPYFKDCDRFVIKRFMTKNQIFEEFGADMSKEMISQFSKEKPTDEVIQQNYMYVNSDQIQPGDGVGAGLLGGLEISPLYPYDMNKRYNMKFFTVYDTEWIRSVIEDGKCMQYRYRCVRIGAKIYIPYGRILDSPRSISNPSKTWLSLNGRYMTDNNGHQFSLQKKLMDFQDEYDLTCFYEDILVHSSGTRGQWMDLAHLPKFLGKTVEERVMRWMASKKSGVGWFDSSQDGEDTTPVTNTTFGGYDETLSAEAIQAFELRKQSIVQEVTNITGVFKERLADIEQRDAVTNVQTGIKQSTFVTKHYYFMMDLVERDINIDILNNAKIVYPKGFTGTVHTTDGNKIFKALPEYYTMTDFGINIMDEDASAEDKSFMKDFSLQMLKNPNGDPVMAMEAATSGSITEMKKTMKENYSANAQLKKQLEDMKQQLAQENKENKQLQGKIDQLQNQIGEFDKEKLEIEKQKAQSEERRTWYKTQHDIDIKQQALQLKDKNIQLQGEQVVNGNGKQAKVREYENE